MNLGERVAHVLSKAVLPSVLATLTLSLSGCEWMAELTARLMGDHQAEATPQLILDRTEPPRIVPPPIPRNAIHTDVRRLPQGARAILPAFDGDGFFVTVQTHSPQDKTADQIFSEVVSPVLLTIGFELQVSPYDLTRQGRIKIPKHSGTELPKLNFVSLARMSCEQLGHESERSQRQNKAIRFCSSLQTLKAKKVSDSLLKEAFLRYDGPSYQQYINAYEQTQIEYFFTQVHADSKILNGQPVPIEHTGILVRTLKDRLNTSITGRVINKYKITNTIALKTESAITEHIFRKLAKIPNLVSWDRSPEHRQHDLLLLEFGKTDGLPQLRYSHRTIVLAEYKRLKGHFYLWLDAESGEILKLQPMFHHATVPARGRTFLRSPEPFPTQSPDPLPITRTDFKVDPSQNGKYALRNADWFANQIGNVAISDSSNGSSSSVANFDQPPFNDVTKLSDITCKKDHPEFQQIDLMATLAWQIQKSLDAGLLSPFPDPEHKITVAFGADTGTASADLTSLNFGSIKVAHSNCLNPSDYGVVNSYNDHTVVAHELGHILTAYQYRSDPVRSNQWCSGGILETPPSACPLPTGEKLFHDFADAWAHVFEDTNCVAGWFGKDQLNGPNGSLDCKAHDEGSGIPRLADTTSGDHFPEHRAAEQGDYADMQIATAALWEVRKGIQRKDPIMGPGWYMGQFVRTLSTTGWLGPLESLDRANDTLLSSDLNIYRGLLDLEIKLLDQWVKSQTSNQQNGTVTANKVTAGFAKAGIFLIPPVCIDGNTKSADPLHCANGEDGGDAVIDIEQRDSLERKDIPPTFHIWTGPAYKFTSDGTATGFKPSSSTPSPCNFEYQIELANKPTFSQEDPTTHFTTSTPSNGIWQHVIPDMGQCEASWHPDNASWNLLKGTSGETKVYYRVRTRMGPGTPEIVSTSPAKHLFELNAPYATVEDKGASEETQPLRVAFQEH